MEAPPFNAPYIAGQWPIANVRVTNNRIERRWDHSVYRTFADGDVVQAMPIYRKTDGTNLLLALTGTDLCRIRTGASETYSYLTDTYTTGHVTGITDDTVTGSGDGWGASGIGAGDKFILEDDLATPKAEPEGTWAAIETVADNTIVLEANYDTYGGTEGDFSGTPKHYRVRRIYSCPATERWQWATVNGKFCFTNADVYAQYWAGSEPEGTAPPAANFATNLNTTYAYKAKYCIGYANRLLLAHLYDTTTAAVNPWLLSASELNDPTGFYGDTGVTSAANYRFDQTDGPITGLGVIGNAVVVYKRTGFHIGQTTNIPSDPLQFPHESRGIGLYAPPSLVHYGGTNAWLGVDDFYRMNGGEAESIGAPIRRKFFDIVTGDNLENVVGMNSLKYNEIYWVAATSGGQEVFVWNYKDNTWTNFTFDSDVSAFGGFGS